eukprot:XP_019920388.1 PREDICTED: aggrecan core protein-like [Crassostrea gigas]
MLLFQQSNWLVLVISCVLCDGSLQPGFSKLQHGHRLDRKVIQSFAESIKPLDSFLNKTNAVEVLYVVDCGIPVKTGIDLSKTKREDAIGIHRSIHASCSDGYFQFGSGRLICQSDGEWKYDISCEEGWVQNENHIYRLFTEKKNWESAKDHCESIDAYLVEIESSEENTWIFQNIVQQHFLPKKNQCSKNIRDCTVWIGGSDKSKETQFIWSKSKNKITFTKWLSNNPDDFRSNEDCIEMLATTGEWNDMSCDFNTHFICEKNLN